jgi:hypothetical protein
MDALGVVPFFAIALIGAAQQGELVVEASEAGVAGPTRHFQVAAGDLDGDGRPDRAILKVDCDQGAVTQAYLAPRDRASGQATGKRQHKPITVIKEWDKSTPLLAMKAGYDVKKVEGTGARTAAGDGWTPVTLTGASSLCALKVSR